MNGPSPRRRDLSVEEYCAGVLECDPAILSRALTLVESSAAPHQKMAEEMLAHLLPHTGQAIRVGITGPPGVGKSTFIEALGIQLVRNGKRLAVLAVDPSSDLSGGSILGDKTRMTRLSSEPNAFIRPSPTAGTLGGVARKTREMMLICEAAGFDVVLVETVGVGQSETMVAEMTDCFLALMLPSAGDELQGIKRGLLELVDVIAVNKADGATRQAAEVSAQQLAGALQSISANGIAVPPVLTCSAMDEQNVFAVWEEVKSHYNDLKSNGALMALRQQHNASWVWSIVDDRVRQSVRDHPAVAKIRANLEAEVLRGQMTPESAARQILEAFGVPIGDHRQAVNDGNQLPSTSNTV